MQPVGIARAALRKLLILVLHLALGAAFIAALITGLRLGSELHSGLHAFRLDVLGSPSLVWFLHRMAAAALVLVGIAYVALRLVMPCPAEESGDLLTALRAGDGQALRFTRLKLRRALLLWAAGLVATGSLLASGVWPEPLEVGLQTVHVVTASGLLAFAFFHAVTELMARRHDAGAGIPVEDASPAAELAVPGSTTIAPHTAPGTRSKARILAVGMYAAGCVLFSLGVKLFIDADLGTDPFGAMVIGIGLWVEPPFVQVGAISSVITLLLLVLWSCFTRQLPPLSTFITMALVGHLIDLWNVLEIEQWTRPLLAPFPMMLLGLFLDAYASALIIMSGIGIRVVDLVALAIVRRWRWHFIEAKLLLEGGFFVVAWLAGGPLGVATVAFVAVVGPFVEPFFLINRHILSLPNSAYPEPSDRR